MGKPILFTLPIPAPLSTFVGAEKGSIYSKIPKIMTPLSQNLHINWYFGVEEREVQSCSSLVE